MQAKKVIIIGASSGIGKALAEVYGANLCELGLAARRQHLLEQLHKTLNVPCTVKVMDVADTSSAVVGLTDLITSMDGVDVIIISAGIGLFNRHLDVAIEQQTIALNVSGFTALADTAFNYFAKRGSGCLAAISSVAAIRGSGRSPAYNASKAFMSNYLEGLRFKARLMKLPITITDIRPGFVATDLLKGQKLPWAASPQKAAKQIYAAIAARKKRAYVTRRWSLIAQLLKIAPDSICTKFG
ncbi:MAG: SDR family NAD(P)-dependent oxidoreductase [Desulfobacterales bacterium]|nr:SDR family NAD(P)-dependent oxidoreductase [Desulfobacterales bacterium]